MHKKSRILLAAILLLILLSGIFSASRLLTPQHSSWLTDTKESFTYLSNIDGELFDVCGGDLNQSAFFQELESRTNIHINWIRSLNETEASYRFKQSSSRMPDLMDMSSLGSHISYDELIDNGTILDLTDLIPKYAPNYYRIIQDPVLSPITHTDSGRIAAIFSLKQEAQKPYAGLQLRKDWLDELGLDVPVTYADWEKVLTAFKEKKGATAPLSLPFLGYMIDNSFLSGFQTSYGFCRIDDTVYYGPAMPGFLEYLSLMNRWYKLGLISPNFMTGTSIYADTAMIASGATGAWYDLYTTPSTIKFHSENSSGEIIAVEPPRKHPSDTLHLRMENSYTDNCLVLSAECKNPALVLRWIDYLFSEEGIMLANYGVEGKTYRLSADGKPQFTSLILSNPEGMSFTKALRYYTFPPGFASSYMDWKRELQAIPQKDIAMCDIWARPDTDYLLPSWLSFTEEETKTLAQITSSLSACMQKYTINFICGITPLDQYDTYLSELHACGLDEAVAIYQTAFDRCQKETHS